MQTLSIGAVKHSISTMVMVSSNRVNVTVYSDRSNATVKSDHDDEF